MDCIVYGVAKSQTQLSDFHFTKVGILNPFGDQTETSFQVLRITESLILILILGAMVLDN